MGLGIEGLKNETDLLMGWVMRILELEFFDIFALINVLQNGGHHTQEDFAVRGKEPKDEVQIYTWKDATLRELTDLVCRLLL